MSKIANNVLLGRTADGARVFVTVETSEQTGHSQTTHHDPISAWTRISITGEIIEKYHHEATSGGQITSALLKITDFAPGWNWGKVRTLVRLWEQYHLNDMKAACAHQVRVGTTTSENLDLTPVCPVTGYRYGRAWLVLPEADTLAGVARLRELFEDGE